MTRHEWFSTAMLIVAVSALCLWAWVYVGPVTLPELPEAPGFAQAATPTAPMEAYLKMYEPAASYYRSGNATLTAGTLIGESLVVTEAGNLIFLSGGTLRGKK